VTDLVLYVYGEDSNDLSRNILSRTACLQLGEFKDDSLDLQVLVKEATGDAINWQQTVIINTSWRYSYKKPS
jgi:hypothetical protein